MITAVRKIKQRIRKGLNAPSDSFKERGNNMTDRVRVKNVTPYGIGLRTQTGIEYNIKPGLFLTMSKDDVEYNMAIAPKLFRKPAQLVVEDIVLNEMMGIAKEDTEVCSKEMAVKYLKGSAAKLRAFLNENNYPHVLETVAIAAKDMDLPSSKIQVLQDFMPQRDFLNN